MDLLTAFVFLLLIIVVFVVGAFTVLVFAVKNFPIVSAIVVAGAIMFLIKKSKQ